MILQTIVREEKQNKDKDGEMKQGGKVYIYPTL